MSDNKQQAVEIHWGGKVFRFESAQEARAAGFKLDPDAAPAPPASIPEKGTNA